MRAAGRVAGTAALEYTAPVPLLDALRALSELEPPPELPPCDLGELAGVLEAHGLAPLASYHVETRRIGAGLPLAFREKLLSLYQGTVNDNVFRMVTLRSVLREAPGVPAVLLGGAAYVDWLYPHLAFRPVGEVQLAVRGEDGPHFAEAAARAGFGLEGTGRAERTARFGDGHISLSIQEGPWPGAPEDPGFFERARPYPALGPSAARPAPEDALLATVAEQALLGLYAPLVTFVDLRELVRLSPPLDPAAVHGRARSLGLSRALLGSMALLAHFFPSVSGPALALRPDLPAAERVLVEAVVESAKDPAKLRHLRGGEAAARAVVGPR
jgi:hypothetical protein